jgi:prepilin-type N-terminal cleavage/methylation domain-containing protein
MKRGFGLLEVLVAAVVLAFLLVGLNTMQKGNREAVLRIRSRDAAQIIAQDFLDSLSRLGLSSIVGDEIIEGRVYEWKGQNNMTASLEYTIDAKITETNTVTEQSNLENLTHTTSKKIDLTVSWPFKKSTQSISMSRIVK